jgi:CMP-N-acetylneuraminic acid synthetase
MKILIPFRVNSTRCHRKNVKPFYYNDSLLDLTIKQFKGYDIILASVFCEESAAIAKKHNASHLFMEEDESEGWAGTVADMGVKVKQWVEPDEPLLVWFATEILFFCKHSARDFIDFSTWHMQWDSCDSTILCRPFKHFLLDHKFRPENFSYGSWMGYSQNIDQKYQVIPGIGMTTPNTMVKHRSVNGPKYKPFIADPLYVDIDQDFEFELAQNIWHNYKGDYNAPI